MLSTIINSNVAVSHWASERVPKNARENYILVSQQHQENKVVIACYVELNSLLIIWSTAPQLTA